MGSLPEDYQLAVLDRLLGFLVVMLSVMAMPVAVSVGVRVGIRGRVSVRVRVPVGMGVRMVSVADVGVSVLLVRTVWLTDGFALLDEKRAFATSTVGSEMMNSSFFFFLFFFLKICYVAAVIFIN